MRLYRHHSGSVKAEVSLGIKELNLSLEERINAAAAAAAAKLLQSCLTLLDPTDSSPLGSSFPGILQARILEWVAISFSRGSSQHRDRSQVSRFAGSRFNL